MNVKSSASFGQRRLMDLHQMSEADKKAQCMIQQETDRELNCESDCEVDVQIETVPLDVGQKYMISTQEVKNSTPVRYQGIQANQSASTAMASKGKRISDNDLGGSDLLVKTLGSKG